MGFQVIKPSLKWVATYVVTAVGSAMMAVPAVVIIPATIAVACALTAPTGKCRAGNTESCDS